MITTGTEEMMRRDDREINDPEMIRRIMQEGRAAQVAFVDGDSPYLVTMNYGFTEIDGCFRLYLHSAPEGRKMECIKKNPHVCFTVVIPGNLIESDDACAFGMQYRSVVGTGKIRIAESEQEIQYGLDSIMEHYTGEHGWFFRENVLSSTRVFCLEVENITGKAR